jgi:hypothetical protein
MPIRNFKRTFQNGHRRKTHPGESGMALPVTLMIVTFLFTLIMLSVSQMVQVRRMQTLYQERVKSRYVAESGIAIVQQQLRLNGQNRAAAADETMIQVEDRYVLVNVDVQPSHVRVQATTWGEQGVVQTVEAFLHPKTYAVSRWIR